VCKAKYSLHRDLKRGLVLRGLGLRRRIGRKEGRIRERTGEETLRNELKKKRYSS
jgi:hypothetical protein